MGSTANIELVSTLKAKKSAEFRFLISKKLHYLTYLPSSKAQSFTILVTDFCQYINSFFNKMFHKVHLLSKCKKKMPEIKI